MVQLCPQQGPKKGLLYINICSWKRVPAPQDPSRPLPVCAGKLETDTDEGQGKRAWATEPAFVLHHVKNTINKWCFSFTGAYTVMDVALNPAVLQDSEEDKAEVYMMALSFAQQQFGLTLSQQYTLISSGPKSSPDDLHRRLGFRQCPKVSKQTDTGRVISPIPWQAAVSPLYQRYVLLLLQVYHLSPSTTFPNNL